MPEIHEFKADSLDAKITGLILPNGLRVSQIRITSKGVSIVPQPFTVRVAQAGTVEAIIQEADLQTYLELTAPGGLKDFEVLLADGKVAVTATAKVLFEVRATALGTLEIADSQKLNIVLESVSVPIAHNVVQNQLAQINPVLDVSGFPFRSSLSKVLVADGLLTLRMDVLPDIG